MLALVIESVPFDLHVWHPGVHSSYGYERLVLWRAAFSPIYDESKSVSILVSLFDEFGINSYSIYELTGEFDLLIQIWIPPRINTFDIDEALRSRLAPSAPQIEIFTASGPPELYIAGEDFVDEVPAPAETLVRKDIDAVHDGAVDEQFIDRLRHSGFLVSTPDTACQPLLIEVVIADRRAPIESESTFRTSLRRALQFSDVVAVASICTGTSNHWGSILVRAQVPYEKLSSLNSALLLPIREAAAEARLPLRTRTHFHSRPHPLVRRERLTAPFTAAVEDRVTELLSHSEDDMFEVKASVFADWARFINSEDNPVSLTQNSELFFEALVKPVVAFLNSNGGTLLIGALERSRFTSQQQLARLDTYPVTGDHIVVGVKNDYFSGDRSWDAYERRLQRLLQEHISPGVAGVVNIRSLEFEGLRLAVIEAVPQPSTWYYAIANRRGGAQVFYVRQGGSSIGLDGIEADRYKLLSPRSGVRTGDESSG